VNEFAVELRGVTKAFASGATGGREVLAVRDVNLAIRQGEFFTLLGPSGCGKTTTLRMIAGFEMPTEGQVLIQGQAMTQVPPYRRPVNTVFQSYALFPHLTILQNVAFGLAVKRVPRAERERRAQEALDMVQLPMVSERKPGQLSGGQQQRVALARALVNRPTVLLLDEPLGALDLKLRKAMQIELKHLQTQVGITFIYVTHDQEEALTMSDRIAVMSQGQVLQVGDPVTIYEQPASRFVADFIGETNFISAHVTGVADGMVSLDVAGHPTTAAAGGDEVGPGQDVTLIVRPEKIILNPPDADSPTVLHGEVREIVYIGTDTRYVVSLASGDQIVVRIQNLAGRGRGEYTVGDQVALSWAAEDARALIA
jgi:spermidine/putrescine transport system ATP-binding protein